ncbi:MAG: hypothetical protein J3Q66DRAFT_404470 [Benniella sp.]|nr:MAG: hypothetical protein J3Q66DRAFT_404470 [Benniella sp.]
MLDLPELHGKVLQRLGRHDLTQCAQVNRQWHAMTIPHIWRDLTCVNSADARGKAFSRLVLEDYLQENGHGEGPPQPSTLSKYGHLIRLLPNPRDLEITLRSQAFSEGDKPTAYDLLFLLFKRSSKAQVQYLRYDFKDLESDNMNSVLAFTLPRVRRLVIQASLQGTQSEFSKLKSLLDQCSTTLESMDIDINALHVYEAVDMEDKTTEDESICWTSLKDLTLRHIPDTWDAGRMWSWMWKRLGRVERLNVRKIDESTPSFVQAMSTYMHNLREITIGKYGFFDWDTNPEDVMEDDVVAALISGCQGWKSVSVKSTARFGRESMNALARHYSTLEELNVDGDYDIPICDVIQVLRSCPHLHTLCYTDWSNGCSVVEGETFVDLDPDTGLLKPWSCEGSLKVLEVKIAGIPRPDLEGESSLLEAYPGRGRDIQRQVYERLGRLTNLEMLRLGGQTSVPLYECLEMSLESGLDKLSGLKSLKILNVGKLATKISTKEVQWMAENWPKLNVIYGVDGYGKNWSRPQE